MFIFRHYQDKIKTVLIYKDPLFLFLLVVLSIPLTNHIDSNSPKLDSYPWFQLFGIFHRIDCFSSLNTPVVSYKHLVLIISYWEMVGLGDILYLIFDIFSFHCVCWWLKACLEFSQQLLKHRLATVNNNWWASPQSIKMKIV